MKVKLKNEPEETLLEHLVNYLKTQQTQYNSLVTRLAADTADFTSAIT